MTAYEKDIALLQKIQRIAPNATRGDANTLRRASMTLSRWGELECGDGNEHASWSIERDEQTGIPHLCTYPHNGKMRRRRVPDRENGALSRVKKVCERLGLHYFYQTDPRGVAIYVDREPLTDSAYSNGIAVG